MTESHGRAWVLEKLEHFISMTEPHNLSRSGSGTVYITSKQGPKASRTQVLEQVDTIERILDRYYPEWQSRLDEWESRHYEFEALRQAAIRCRARIRSQDELDQHLDADSPSIRVNNLHPWVWDAARPQWETGHYTEAVAAAARSINSHLQQKVGRRDVADKKLFQEAFSTKPTTEDAARLRVPPDDGSSTARSIQEGVLAFGAGCMQAIRNPLAHLADEERDLTEHQATERLAALSLLSHWTDSSSLELHEKP